MTCLHVLTQTDGEIDIAMLQQISVRAVLVVALGGDHAFWVARRTEGDLFKWMDQVIFAW